MAKTMCVQRTWGPWTFHPRQFNLNYRKGRSSYVVDLDKCEDAADVLDWIMQMPKAWMSDKDVGHLAEAFRDIFHPQSNMCTHLRNTKIKPREVAASNGYPVGAEKQGAGRRANE